ncbi:MAG TPA: hypothetical protein VGS13_08820 [Stellaceae bacterium]|nr:hypothetical protein [Stellaceae bacterium]
MAKQRVLLIAAALVISVLFYLQSSDRPSSAKAGTTCLPKYGVQICYPEAWKTQESEERVRIESKEGETFPFLSMNIEIKHPISSPDLNSNITEASILKFFGYENKKSLEDVTGYKQYAFSIPNNSKRHYAKLYIMAQDNGAPMALINPETKNLTFSYWRARLTGLFPTENGLLGVSCYLMSRESGEVPTQARDFANSLARACETLIEKVDES